MAQDPPPEFEPNSLNVYAQTDSKITNVSLYTGRAEITRSFHLSLKAGQNLISIHKLPNVLDKQSLRVEGRGSATIHDVSVTKEPVIVVNSSPKLDELRAEQKRVEQAWDRTHTANRSLESMIKGISLQFMAPTDVPAALEMFETQSSQLTSKLTEMKKRLKEIENEISEELTSLNHWGEGSSSRELNMLCSVGMFADREGEVDLILIYAVGTANWTASYDIRVDLQTKEAPVTVVYKASVVQSTGEPWINVPLTLETASPVYGVGVPVLPPWRLFQEPTPGPQPVIVMASQTVPWRSRRSRSPRTHRSRSSSRSRHRRSSPAYSPRAAPRELEPVMHQTLTVESKGNINATFRVPGLVTIPSDGVAHSFTISQSKLDALLSWIVVPKIDTRAHLSAKIKNASEYTFISGTANVYVDGSFIATSQVPIVSPLESFDCSLGIDPSIKVTYHPQSKKQSTSGFYTKSSSHTFQRFITVENTKAISIDNLKIIEQIPVSDNNQIIVKLVNPPLPLTSSGGDTSRPSENPKFAPVHVASGILAQWDGFGEADGPALGRDGKLNWVCEINPRQKIQLGLIFEVTSPHKMDVAGL